MLLTRWLVSIVTLCALAALTWYSVLLARADASFRENDLASLQNAVRLTPSNASYHAILAEHMEAAGANPDAELETASNLSPRESRYWIRRGFRAEVEQKYDDSERYLMEAYRVDRGFAPRWALMNYYFRRGKTPEFWRFTRESLAMSYGNLDPVFRLCLAVNVDPSITRQALPPKREILFSFFEYLLNHELVESATAIARELAPDAQEQEVAALVDYCGRQMGHDNRSSLEVWNALCRRRRLPFAELAPERGRIVTNGDFVALSLQKGFDWKYRPVDGVTVGSMETAQGLLIEISGQQPDTGEVISQQIPLTAGKQYVLDFEYRLIGTQPDSGLEWVVRGSGPDEVTNPEPIARSSVLAATDWNTGQMTFSAGHRDAARLVLQYRRAPGTLRWKGGVEIRHVSSGLRQESLPH